MLLNIKALYGHQLAASDGTIGHIKDFYFDDHSWVIRYLVADTGSWLSGRQVLLSPHAFGRLDPTAKTLAVNLTRKQIEESPSIESHQPVSRQYEVDYYRHYGWPAYWNGAAMWGFGGYPVLTPPLHEEIEANQKHHHRDEKHLQSTKAVNGYAIHATDGQIGSLSDLIVQDRSWAVADLAVEAGHWYAGKEILIPTTTVSRISYETSEVFVNLTKSALQHTAKHDVVKAGA